MRRAVVPVCLVCSAAALAWATRSTPAQDAKPAKPEPVKWEYRVVEQLALDKVGGLDKAGDKGWELTAVTPEVREATSVNDKTGLISTITARERTYYFKRAK